MLTEQENKRLTSVGPGTEMGELFRRFWIPFLEASELPGPDCTPVRTKLLGEELLAFRDTNGKVGLVDRYCPHRGTELFFGRNEECGLRCTYHGWKFDVDGNCVDMPSEPPQSNFAERIKIKSYPAVDYGGAIWAYMGPKELKPELPQVPWADVPSSHLLIAKNFSPNNYAQSLEGDIDSAHVSFLHFGLSNKQREDKIKRGEALNFTQLDSVPLFDVRTKDYGLLIGARRTAEKGGHYKETSSDPEEDAYYWRFTQFLMPCHTLFPRDFKAPGNGHSWVPRDDETTWTWSFHWRDDRPLSDEEREKLLGPDGIYPKLLPDGSFKTVANAGNDYLIDRDLQRDGNYTGIVGIRLQDLSIIERMGVIMDRSKEHLGTSDVAIIAFRRLMLKMAADLQAGNEPYAASHPELFRINSGAVVLPKDVDWEEAAKDYLTLKV